MKIFFRKDSFTIGLLLAILIVSVEVELWALVLSWTLIFYRWGVERNWWKIPKKIWINALALVALGLVLFQFRTFTGQEPSSTFLVMLTAIRIVDFRQDRDEKLLIFLGFVLISLKFLYSLDLYLLPIGITIFLSLWRALLPADYKKSWSHTFISLAKSTPIVALLFFAFPRVQVPWARQWQPPVALTGFSESVSPGEIADLSLSTETVMRVEFTDYIPNLSSLYWRGAVLEKTDGFGWKKVISKGPEVATPQASIGHDYSVTLEPSFQKNLPVLEHTRMITSPGFRAHKNDRGVFTSDNTVITRIRYLGQSTDSWSGPTVENPTELPPLPPRTTDWLKAANAKKMNFQEKLRYLRDFFTKNGFVYTRQPGRHANLDEFLFDRRQGFCEHYAGAYAVLARGLGLPARVITGYQGGEKNSSGGFIRVTQADAHAWVEVQEPKGLWRRVDPTFWIAPLRIELGALSFFQLAPDDLKLSPFEALDKLRKLNQVSSFVSSLQNQIENLNYLWIRSLLDFDLSEQQRLIQFLAPQMGWWISILVLSILSMRLIRRWLEKRQQRPPVAARHYLWIESKLQSLGLQRDPATPPIQFLQEVGQKKPELQSLAQKTIQMYRFERYKNHVSSPEDWKRILRGWKEKVAKPQA